MKPKTCNTCRHVELSTMEPTKHGWCRLSPPCITKATDGGAASSSDVAPVTPEHTYCHQYRRQSRLGALWRLLIGRQP